MAVLRDVVDWRAQGRSLWLGGKRCLTGHRIRRSNSFQKVVFALVKPRWHLYTRVHCVHGERDVWMAPSHSRDAPPTLEGLNPINSSQGQTLLPLVPETFLDRASATIIADF